jgi:ribosome-associated protein
MRVDHVEGYDEGSWILLDFSDIVVHIFLGERREYYNLELLWNDAPSMEFTDEQAAGRESE